MLQPVQFPRLLTTDQAAQLLQVPVARICYLVRTRQLPAIRVGRQIRISEEALLAWVNGGGSPSGKVAAPLTGDEAAS